MILAIWAAAIGAWLLVIFVLSRPCWFEDDLPWGPALGRLNARLSRGSEGFERAWRSGREDVPRPGPTGSAVQGATPASAAGPGHLCPNCGRPAYDGGVCGRCGWGYGWQPAYEVEIAAIIAPGRIPPTPPADPDAAFWAPRWIADVPDRTPAWVQAILDAPLDKVLAGAW